MTKLLEDAIAAVRQLPASVQDDLARFMIALADEDQLVLHPDEAAAIAEANAELARGERASPETVEAFWRSHGL